MEWLILNAVERLGTFQGEGAARRYRIAVRPKDVFMVLEANGGKARAILSNREVYDLEDGFDDVVARLSAAGEGEDGASEGAQDRDLREGD